MTAAAARPAARLQLVCSTTEQFCVPLVVRGSHMLPVVLMEASLKVDTQVCVWFGRSSERLNVTAEQKI